MDCDSGSSMSDGEDGDSPEFVASDCESDLDDALLENHCPLPEPTPKITEMQNVKIIVTWLLYFMLVWQYKNYVSDSAIEGLLAFFEQFLLCIGQAVQQHVGFELVMVIATNLPTTLYTARRFLGINRDQFEQFMVCPSCTKLYQMGAILVHNGQKVIAKPCNHVAFPRSARAKPCGAKLAKEVFMKDGSSKFYPLKTYCYRSIVKSIENILKRPGLEEECEKWRTRVTDETLYADVYDGKVWKDFHVWNGLKRFLSRCRTYGLMMNIDWFQPFKHRNDCSVGALYIVLMNLPRHLRFRQENVILVGIIPALEHEPKSLNTFLEPVVKELKVLWSGVKVTTYNSPSVEVEIHGALLCCASDIPAAGKLCGFLGHSASRGCSHCYNNFPGGFGQGTDYSGFADRDLWPKRTSEQHGRDAMRTRNCKSKTQRRQLESKLGCRYTALLQLPYFATSTMCVIDPMHNLFLGTAKRVFSLWIRKEILSKTDLSQIQQRIERISATSDLGRLPGNISSNYGGFTSAQWKNFILLYSMYALEGVPPDQHLRVWLSFVVACRHLCKPCITETDLLIGDRKLFDFVISFERLYGKLEITPNMHLHMHLKECILNYGSIYGFWLFSFERYNGILGSYHTNNRAIEIQVMRKFVTSGILSDLQHHLPKQYEQIFTEHCCHFLEEVGPASTQDPFHLQMATSGLLAGKEKVWMNLSTVILPPSFKLGSLDSDSALALRSVYRKLYPQVQDTHLNLPMLFRKYPSITMSGEKYGSSLNLRLGSYGNVMASWCGDGGAISLGAVRPGIVHYYVLHSAEIGNRQVTHLFAAVKWPKPAAENFGYKNPLSVWRAKDFEGGPSTFIPVQRIHSRFISTEELHSGLLYLIVSPLTVRIPL